MNPRRIAFLIVPAFCCGLLLPFVAASRAAPEPPPGLKHALIISVDGLRPDLLLRARAPHMRGLLETGSFSLWARTVPESVTLPSHTSMLTGVSVPRHGVTWNGDRPGEPVYPKVPTLFELAKRRGLTTAMVTGKSKFTALAKPGTLDWASIAGSSDEDTARRAVDMLKERQPDVMFVHFPGVDGTGHSKGWGSPEQIAKVEEVDGLLGKLLAALDELKRADSTLVLLSADHGGAGRSHGPEDPRSRHIPWVVRGPGVRKNYDLTGNAALNVRTEDTFATVCWLLKIPGEGEVEGRPVVQILADRELLEASPTGN